jgi:hypothetical protein
LSLKLQNGKIKIAAHLSLSCSQQLNPLMNWKQFKKKKIVCMSKQDEGGQEHERTVGRVSLSLQPISSYINCCTESYTIFIRLNKKNCSN